jgi:DNA-binding response OmpR family regulator
MSKIIIVEDDPMISEIYQRKFSESGYETLVAGSGDQVLALASKEKVDVILLDLIMPKMDGFEVIEKIRNGNYDKNIKIIVFSNLSQQEDRNRALNLGANGFIVKSNYTPSSLIKEVRRITDLCEEGKRNEAIRNGEKTPADPVGNGKKKKVLLIEDEEIFVEMFGDKLKQNGYDVTSAQNGAWGFKEALASDFDIFIVDLVMPVMTGDEIIKKLKMEEKTKNIPIIAISASIEDETGKEILKLGADKFFVKTQIIPSKLVKEVDELLESREGEK